ncbi:hypothetical protein ABB37_08615 [Leptomonas pyrrhocoris]|uniref:Uncharacterized protein n=1 Tax=Leptomonas pyrrhocoris TaxID=157538 RepID=A0A0N0DRX8_LEPPY|nr:hypothetical protein ABB37_08615 [Leptomonas pyrrhocoris]KPA75318.1 hypothetical protein ABB37_08615 [Leptomonas pyrrhocoris]|eukprot:XP_015653757.1 hypothetical protein ABB37_08615 [Leptomonas pyrrhocoris]
MGQDGSTPVRTPRTDRPARRTRLSKQASPDSQAQGSPSALEAHEEEHAGKPTLKEQWQAKREANALTREANAAERRRKKEALHAALVAQQKQEEKDKKTSSGGGDGDVEEDEEELRLRQASAEAEAALTQAQVSAQLAVFQAFMQNNPDVEEELDNYDGNPSSLFDRGVASCAARKTTNDRQHGGGGNKTMNAGDDDDEDEIPGEVSVHSSDYEDAELLQGLNDLDEELEAEFQQQIESLQAQVAQHKQASLVCLRERNDKAAALQELQQAKVVEGQIKQLLDSHAEPFRVQMQKQEKKVAELEALVAARKQDSLAALRAGDKPTALEKLKESKGFQSQLEDAKAKLTALAEEQKKQLRSTGES